MCRLLGWTTRTPTTLTDLLGEDDLADGPLEDDDPEYYTLRYRVTGDAVVVSSSGWGRDWQELGDGELLAVRRRTLETTATAAAGLGVPS